MSIKPRHLPSKKRVTTLRAILKQGKSVDISYRDRGIKITPLPSPDCPLPLPSTTWSTHEIAEDPILVIRVLDRSGPAKVMWRKPGMIDYEEFGLIEPTGQPTPAPHPHEHLGFRHRD